ncbi:MAG: type IV pilin N-terminal domain-containing protein [Natrialbaceae archaeon]|nr:type IV pilin N-terminal domain-containing protein [Natrialbaceae archaeon]
MHPAKKLIGSEEERAVSPVIGVILMVAITVILAAVIAAFVMDIGPGGSAVTGGVDVSGGGTDSVSLSISDSGNADSVVLVDGDGNIQYQNGQLSTGQTVTVDVGDGGIPAAGSGSATEYTIYFVQNTSALSPGDPLDSVDGQTNMGSVVVDSS